MTRDDGSLRAAIVAAIEGSGLSYYAVSQRAGVDESLIGRYVRGERDITTSTADKVMSALGLRVANGTGSSPRKKIPK